VVLLFDYYLIKALCPEDLEEYLDYLCLFNAEGISFTEELLFSGIKLPAQWHEKLKQLVKDICSISI